MLKMKGIPKSIFLTIPKCQDCSLCKKRHYVVMLKNYIRPRADILVIADAPSKSDDLLNSAFSGLTGSLFNEMLSDAKILPAHVNVTFAVLCRPLDDNDEQRDPLKSEMKACQKNVLDILKEVSPLVIVFASPLAQKQYQTQFNAGGMPVFTIFHPSLVVKKGGRTTTEYFHNVRILEDARDSLHGKRV